MKEAAKFEQCKRMMEATVSGRDKRLFNAFVRQGVGTNLDINDALLAGHEAKRNQNKIWIAIEFFLGIFKWCFKVISFPFFITNIKSIAFIGFYREIQKDTLDFKLNNPFGLNIDTSNSEPKLKKSTTSIHQHIGNSSPVCGALNRSNTMNNFNIVQRIVDTPTSKPECDYESYFFYGTPNFITKNLVTETTNITPGTRTTSLITETTNITPGFISRRLITETTNITPCTRTRSLITATTISTYGSQQNAHGKTKNRHSCNLDDTPLNTPTNSHPGNSLFGTTSDSVSNNLISPMTPLPRSLFNGDNKGPISMIRI